MHARGYARKVATASFRVIYATPVWLYIVLRILCVTRAARVSVMVRRHQTAIGCTEDNLYDMPSICVKDAPGEKVNLTPFLSRTINESKAG